MTGERSSGAALVTEDHEVSHDIGSWKADAEIAHSSSAGEASERWSVGQSRSISSLCAVCRRGPTRGG